MTRGIFQRCRPPSDEPEPRPELWLAGCLAISAVVIALCLLLT